MNKINRSKWKIPQ